MATRMHVLVQAPIRPEPAARATTVSHGRSASSRIGSAARRLGVALAAVLLVAAACYALGGMFRGPAAWARPQDAAATAGLIGLAILGYIGWASRWNIPAHLMLGFALTAYLVPTCLGDTYSRFPHDVLDLYDAVVITGFVCAAVGTAIGAELPLPRWAELRWTMRRVAPHVVHRRVLVITIASAVLLLGSFAVMGFIPALASDPLNAKFFRGEYAAMYAPVAPVYRATTSTLILLLPVITMYAVWRRRWYWMLLLPVTVMLLVCTLQRGSAVAGILLFTGVALALLRRRIWIRSFAAGLVLVFGFGSVSYFVLAGLGLGAFAPSQVDTSNLSAVVAAGAPDVSDQVGFLGAWLSHPVYTFGRTAWGGLLPNHFEWNPAVWSLTVTNPHGSLNDITSGGLRLPAPLWGLVSFGWIGVVVFSTMSGIVFGVATASIRRAVGLLDRERITLAIVLYAVVVDVLGKFFTLGYMGVLQLVVLAAVLFLPPALRRRRHRA